MVAMLERMGEANRDIFDTHFFLKNNWPINDKILEKRTGLSMHQFLKKCERTMIMCNYRQMYLFFLLIILGNTIFPMIGFREAKKTEITIEIFKNLPTLETQRLFLRKVQPDDIASLNQLLSDEEITSCLLLKSHQTEKDTQEYIEKLAHRAALGQPNLWAYILKANNKLIGLGGFTSVDEIGTAMTMYAILKPYWHQGFAPEALKRIIECGFHDIKLNRIEGYCLLANVRSARVMEKSGMQHEGTLRECAYGKNGYWSSKLYAILKTDLPK